MLRCGLAVRRAAKGADSLEAAAGAIVRHLYEACRAAATGERQCAMVRFYKTHDYGELDPELQAFARAQLGEADVSPGMKCLVLLGTAGEEPAWNDRRASRRHRAIPLPSERFVEQAPMIAQLVRQLGLPINALVRPSQEIVGELQGKTYNVFHVEEAAGSPYIPAQAEFVVRYGVRSVLGFGGMLQSGDLFAVVMFARVPIGRDVAERFRTIALDVKSSIFLYRQAEVFSA